MSSKDSRSTYVSPRVLTCLHCVALLHDRGRQDHLQPRLDALIPPMDAGLVFRCMDAVEIPSVY